MAREKGKLERVLSALTHHVGDRKADQIWGEMFPGNRVPIAAIQYRFNLVCEPLTKIADQMKRLRAAANAGDLGTIRAILDEEIEYGHDFAKLANDDESVGNIQLSVRE